MVNVAAFVHDGGDWPADGSMVAPASREDVQSVFRDWEPALRHLVSLLPEELDKWALFDTWDWPAPHYNKGKMCLAGDAAHASTPHHGAGACMGIEDVLCLVTLVEAVNHSVGKGRSTKGQALTLAFEVFNRVRRPRTQWLVDSSRRMCDLYHQREWGDPKRWTKAQVCFEEILDRTLKIWQFDYEGMIHEASAAFERELG